MRVERATQASPEVLDALRRLLPQLSLERQLPTTAQLKELLAAPGSVLLIARSEGRIIGTATLNIHDGVALLAGASTLPEFRRRGAQSLLLRARLSYAHAAGCDIAMMAALPGSTSQMNAERQGFRIAYTRTKWQRANSAARVG